MPFIKTQKVVFNADGTIASGSAAIVDTVYVKTGTKNHSKQTVRERLGKIISMNSDKKSGIFLSQTRGLVAYDVVKDVFSEVKSNDSSTGEKNMLFRSRDPHRIR